jgi:lipopolysaccharide biosynthesis regulator YciM
MNTTKIFLEELTEALERAMERVVDLDAEEISDIMLDAVNGNPAAKRAITKSFDRSEKVKELANLAEAAVQGIEHAKGQFANEASNRVEYFLGMEFRSLKEAIDAYTNRYPRNPITVDDIKLLNSRVRQAK